MNILYVESQMEATRYIALSDTSTIAIKGRVRVESIFSTSSLGLRALLSLASFL